MTIRHTARKPKAKVETVPSTRTRGKVIDPGMFELPELDILRQQAEGFNPSYQISCLLSEFNESRDLDLAPQATSRLKSVRTPAQEVTLDPELLREQVVFLNPVREISSLLTTFKGLN